MTAESKTRIVIIGAGYAGLIATVRLAGKTRKQNVSITLVNMADVFVERLRLHEMAANPTIPQKRIADILKGTGVTFVQGAVTGVDLPNHAICVQTGSESLRLEYDKLIYALGSTIDRDSVAGVRENAYVLTPSGTNSVEALSKKLPEVNARGGTLLICGGGATGIESAAEFAEAFPKLHVELVTQNGLGDFIKKPIADYMRQMLSRFGVTITEHKRITEIQAGQAITADGSAIPFDICLWTGGFSTLPLAREAGLTVNERGQILIDPFMRSISHPEVYAVGDASHPVEEPGAPVRMSAFYAAVSGANVADCLALEARGQTPKPFSFAYYGQAIALGEHNAVAFSIYPDDKPRGPMLTGKAGYNLRAFFLGFFGILPNLERRMPGALFWTGKGRYAAAKRRAERDPLKPVQIHMIDTPETH
ncbi:MAG: FAD-dependent oxidoreductase [Chloroflexota bacterium]